MRGAGRIILGLVLVLAIVAVAGFFLRKPIAGALIAQGLRSAGIESPSLEVRGLSLDRLTLAEVQAGRDNSVDLDRVEIGFNWREALFGRRVERVSVGPGSVGIDIAADGTIRLAGLPLKASGQSGGGLPFDSLTVDAVDVRVRAPEGSAEGKISGAFNPEEGGNFTVAGETALLATDALRIENAKADFSATLAKDGSFEAVGDLSGAFAAPALAASNVALVFDARGSGWREFVDGDRSDLAGAASIDMQSAEISTAGTPLLAILANPDRFSRGAINTLSLSGGLTADFGEGRFSVSAIEGRPLNLVADRGDALLVTGVDGAPLYEEDGAKERIGVLARLTGQALSGEATVTAERENAGPWSFDAGADLNEQLIAGVSLGATSVQSTGVAEGDRFNADVDVSTTVKSASVGRLNILDAAVSSTLSVTADYAAKEFTATTLADDCVFMKSGRFTLEGQDTEARLANALLCPGAGPLLVAQWSDAPNAEVIGRLTAPSASLKLGQTRFAGNPPAIDFTAHYDPRRQLTVIDGVFNGGRVVLNESLVGVESQGTFTWTLEGAAMSAEAAIAKVKVSQNLETAYVAPVIVHGAAQLANDTVDFTYTAATPEGAPLGRGVGVHDVQAGVGQTTFQSGRLVFQPRKLQPSGIIPAVRGIIGDTVGAASGEARFSWGRKPEDFRSAADLSFENLIFRGPGVAVSKTSGLTGNLALTSLTPLQTDGPQSFSVKLLDLDALQLENGVINYYLPGDGTVRVIDADFPWFGGVIGAYDTVASLSGARIETALRTQNVDLAQMLAFLKIKGLSGEGRVEGVLPLVFEGGKARINDGILTAIGPGVIRYTGQAADAAASSGEGARLAFDILRELNFEKLSAEINGPLDGDLSFKIVFEGTNDVTVNNKRVASPIIYRISIDAPLLALIDQARVSTDFLLQFERLQGQRGSQQ